MLAIMIENNISMDHSSARMPDEHKSCKPVPCDESHIVIPLQDIPPEVALQLHQNRFDELPSVEDELGHLCGEAGETTIRKSIDTSVKREKPPVEALAKQLSLTGYEANNDQAKTGLKRTYPTVKSGPKSKPKALKSLIPKVEEWDLMPELGINELRRKYKVYRSIKMSVSVNQLKCFLFLRRKLSFST
jgi:hypothetical protein